MFRNVAISAAGCKSSRYHQEIASRGTIYDMDTDPSDDHVITVGQVGFLPMSPCSNMCSINDIVQLIN